MEWEDVVGWTICGIAVASLCFLVGVRVAEHRPITLWQNDYHLMSSACKELGTHHIEVTESELAVQCGDGTYRRFRRP